MLLPNKENSLSLGHLPVPAFREDSYHAIEETLMFESSRWRRCPRLGLGFAPCIWGWRMSPSTTRSAGGCDCIVSTGHGE